MNLELGVALIAVGSAIALAVVFAMWPRSRPPVALAAVSGAALLVGAGALLVQDRPSAGEWIAALLAMVVLGPVHARLVFGRAGRAR